MDQTTAISVESLSKIYRIFEREDLSDNLIGSLAQLIKNPLSNYRRYRSLYTFDDVFVEGQSDAERNDCIWALRDVNFEVKQGEVVGIIGTNGAGKSTLLKVLSKITAPTRGRAVLRGRISSLLEVGTGFHAELSGRENVYLNGTILGMTKREIDRKFDEIVDFAGVDKFLDTPVKRYSSGMRVRLAFAVAAHLEPEILIVDEVLAVGDAAFQKKCLDKLEDVGAQGRTVLFVSHNMPAVRRLCPRALLLHNGSIVREGPCNDIVGAYLNEGYGTSAIQEWNDPATAPGDGHARLLSIRIKTSEEATRDSIDFRESFGIEMQFEVLREGRILNPYFKVFNDEGVKIFTAVDDDSNWHHRERPEGRYTVTGWVPGHLLNEGTLLISPALRSVQPAERHFNHKYAVAVQITNTAAQPGTPAELLRGSGGIVSPRLRWETQWDEQVSDSSADPLVCANGLESAGGR